MSGTPPLRAVLFDAAGTLIETAEPVGETYARAARAHGVELPARRLGDAFARVARRAPPAVFPGAAPERVRALEKDWWRDVVRGTIRAADGTARFADFDAFFEELWKRYAEATAWRTRPGARDALLALRARGIATGVVSNFDGRLPAILEGLELAALLDVVALPSRAGAAKPDARIFAWALEQLRTAPGEAAFVGDDPERDLAGARRLGLRAVDVRALATLHALPAHVTNDREPLA